MPSGPAKDLLELALEIKRETQIPPGTGAPGDSAPPASPAAPARPPRTV